MSPTATYESRTLFLMSSLQYYCILGLTGKKLCIPETKLCAKDAGCAGNKITEFKLASISKNRSSNFRGFAVSYE